MNNRAELQAGASRRVPHTLWSTCASGSLIEAEGIVAVVILQDEARERKQQPPGLLPMMCATWIACIGCGSRAEEGVYESKPFHRSNAGQEILVYSVLCLSNAVIDPQSKLGCAYLHACTAGAAHHTVRKVCGSVWHHIIRPLPAAA